MSFSSLIAVVLTVGIIASSIHESGMNAGFFVNFHGVVIVLCGTLTAALMAFPLPKVFGLTFVFIKRVLGRNRIDYAATIEQILELNKKVTMGLSSLKETIPNIRHEFLKEGVELVASGVHSEKEIREIMEQRLGTVEERYEHDASMFHTIAKFPPAFGLLATTLGMIALLQQLGKPGAEKLIGPAMSIGLVGTLYGISLANFVFLPIGDALHERTKEEIALRKMIVEGVCMLKSQVNPVTMRENLNSHVLPKERVKRRAA